MRADPPTPADTPPISLANATERLALDWVLGAEFRSELRGALYLRRIPESAVRADDAEEMRADTLLRFLESDPADAETQHPRDRLRRAVSLAVYHHYCRDARRRRALRGGVLEVRETDWPLDDPAAADPPEADSTADPNNPPRPPEDPSAGARRRLAGWPLRGAIVASGRAAVRRLLASLSERQMWGRGGRASDARELARASQIAGVVRWIREFEGDRSGGGVAGCLAERSRASSLSEPDHLLRAIRESTRWNGAQPKDLARLAHAAVTNPPADW